jgi:hypothetical protein
VLQRSIRSRNSILLRTILGYYDSSFVVFVYLLAPIG